MLCIAALAAMRAIAIEMVAKVAGTFWGTTLLGKLMGEDFSDGISSIAMQQGGMGLILTTLILTAPPMAAMFFQGTLGSFMAYSQIGGSGAGAQPGPQGQPPGAAGSYTPPRPASENQVSHANETLVTPRVNAGQPTADLRGQRGNANANG